MHQSQNQDAETSSYDGAEAHAHLTLSLCISNSPSDLQVSQQDPESSRCGCDSHFPMALQAVVSSIAFSGPENSYSPDISDLLQHGQVLYPNPANYISVSGGQEAETDSLGVLNPVKARAPTANLMHT